MAKILVLYHSRLGSVERMATLIARGANTIDGCEAILRTVAPVSNNLDQDAKEYPESGAPYAELDDLAECDGLIVGSPTRFGNMSAEMKYFFDSSSKSWMQGALEGKPAGVFTSSSSMHGGQETTLLSMMIPLLHHGMVISGIPYSNPELGKTQTGGTPYGASHVAGSDNSAPISDDEKALCIALGARVGALAKKLKS